MCQGSLQATSRAETQQAVIFSSRYFLRPSNREDVLPSVLILRAAQSFMIGPFPSTYLEYYASRPFYGWDSPATIRITALIEVMSHYEQVSSSRFADCANMCCRGMEAGERISDLWPATNRKSWLQSVARR